MLMAQNIDFMLPFIDESVNLHDVPYRLPSRCNSYSAVNGQMHSEKSSRNSRYPSPASRAYTSLDYYSKRKEEIKLARLIPLNSSAHDDMDYKRSQFKQSNRRMGQISRLDDMQKLFNVSQRLLWIDELKQWIVEEPSVREFVQLSKKATMYENELSRGNMTQIRTQEEIEFCDRFSNHLRMKRTEDQNVALVHKYNTTHKNVLEPVSVYNKIPRQVKFVGENEENTSVNRSTEPQKSKRYVVDHNNGQHSSLKQSHQPEGYEPIINDKDDNDEGGYIIGDRNEDNGESNVSHGTNDDNVVHRDNDLQGNEILPVYMGTESSTTRPFSNTESIQEVAEQSMEQIFYENKIHNAVVMLTESQNLETNHQTSKEKAHELIFRRPSEPVRFKSIIKQRVMFNFIAPTKLECRELKKVNEKVNFVQKETIESIELPDFVSESVIISEPPFLDLSSMPEKIVDKDEMIPSVEVPEVERDIMAPLLAKPKQRWGKKIFDSSYADQLESERLAEVRKLKIRKKLQLAIESSKRIKSNDIPDGPRFESYGFLAKYCILKKINVGLYRNTFDVCDEAKKQWLNNDELMMALKGINPNLRDYDVAHMNMVMKTCDYDMRMGADFKLFSVLAALSVQISTLDSWVKNYIGMSEFRLMQKRIQYCKKLWECLVDPETNTISVNSLCVELKAGGVTQKHINEVRQRLDSIGALNLIDFLTYIPLFILIHMSIIDNPLDMTERF